MPDPFDTLPDELCIICISLAINGQQAGPLEFLSVSKRWDALMLDTPSLWTQIYIENGEDEIARVSTFLKLSRGCSLHVNIMTALPTLDGLQLIADHMAKVTTVSIRPGPSDTMTAFHMEQWKNAAPHILATLTNGLLEPDVEDDSCFGVSLWEDNQLYYCIILMQFTMATTAKNKDKQNAINSPDFPTMAYCQTWEERVKESTRVSADEDAKARTGSIHSLVELASNVRHHGAIRTAIPSCIIRLLKDGELSVQLATVKVLHTFAAYAELRETLGVAIPSLVNLLEMKSLVLVRATVSLLGKLVEHEELRESLGLAIPSLIKLLEHRNLGVPLGPVSLLKKQAKYDELREVLKLAIPSLIGLLGSPRPWIRSAVASLIGKLAQYGQLREALALTMPSLIPLLQHETRDLQPTTASLIQKLAEYDKPRKALTHAIPSLIKLLKHKDEHVVCVVISLFGKLTEHEELREALVLSTPSLVKLLQHKDSSVQLASISLVGTLFDYDKHREAVTHTVPLLINLLTHRNSGVQSAAISLLQKLAEYDKPREALRDTIPLLIYLLTRWDSDVRSASASLFGKLAEHEEYCETIRHNIPSLIKLLEYGDRNVQSAAVSLLGKLAEHEDVAPKASQLGYSTQSLAAAGFGPYLIRTIDSSTTVFHTGQRDFRTHLKLPPRVLGATEEFHEATRVAIPALIKTS